MTTAGARAFLTAPMDFGVAQISDHLVVENFLLTLRMTRFRNKHRMETVADNQT